MTLLSWMTPSLADCRKRHASSRPLLLSIVAHSGARVVALGRLYILGDIWLVKPEILDSAYISTEVIPSYIALIF